VGLLETDLVVLGAPTGAGKTTLAAIFAQHASEAGARVHYFALEAHRNEIEMRMLFRIMSRLAWQRCVGDQQALEAFTYRRWCHGLCESVVTQVEAEALAELRRKTRTMATFYRSGKFNTDRLVEQMHRVRGESDLIILDHLHFLDDGQDDEIRAMSRTVKTVSDAIQDARTPVIAIAHLRKMDVKSKRVVPHIAEFHGSSDITKVATMVITLAPVDRPRLVPWVADTYMHVSKDRLEGEQNLTAILGFDMRSNSYERGYELGRLLAGGTKWEAVPIAELPWWAVNERRRMSWQS
jgi:replicative DNA helicase